MGVGRDCSVAWCWWNYDTIAASFCFKEIANEETPSSIVQFSEDIEIAMKPPPHNPSQKLSLRPGACNFASSNSPETPVPPVGGCTSAPGADDVSEPRTPVRALGLAATHERGAPIIHLAMPAEPAGQASPHSVPAAAEGDEICPAAAEVALEHASEIDLFADLASLSAAAAGDAEK